MVIMSMNLILVHQYLLQDDATEIVRTLNPFNAETTFV